MVEHRQHHLIAFGVGENELLGEIRQNAEPLRARIDHEVDAAALAVEIEFAGFSENGWSNREDAPIGPLNSRTHDACPL